MFLGDIFVVCTPKKCGTHSVHSALRGEGKVITPWHRRDWKRDGRHRVMMVRHPLDRWYSQYRFTLKVEAWCWQVAAKGINAWAENFFSARSKGGNTKDWTHSCMEYAHEFEPDEVFRLEDGKIFEKDLPHNYSTGYESDETRPWLQDLDEVWEENLRDWAKEDLRCWY